MMVTLPLAILLTAFAHLTDAIALDQLQLNEQWSQWKRVHGKQYADQWEHDRRQNQWMQNVVEIMQHNVQYDLGLVTYAMGVNQYSDLSWEEFRDRYATGFLGDMFKGRHESTAFNVSKVDEAIADSIDWRQKGLVRPVKNQGQCGSCWAFSTTGAIEGQYAKKYGRPIEFSEQQLVDCSTSYGNHGCHGGLMENAYRYLEKFGLELENAYPYHAHDERCHFDGRKAAARVQSFSTEHTGNEQTLKAMVSSQGPIAIAVDADRGFHQYSRGIYQSPSCSSRSLNHAVLVVGYGEDRGNRYWTVKNSWGPDWGEGGYIRLARDHGNMCGVASMASVPQIN